MRAVRVAGVNLPVYAGFVLAWHASAYYRESRDRALRAMELESSLQQAQLAALRSQLNPHFLFNALHSIAELVHANPKLAEDLIVRLGELLRKVLESSHSQEVTLSEELEFIRGYVEIEQMRLGERLQVRWDIDPDALRARVPSLVLQPLVENAIQHGISPLTQPGTLAIRAARADGSLVLEVRDSGPGLDSAAALPRSGIGLANTRVRLESLYGARQSLELANHDGFAVRVRIPFSSLMTIKVLIVDDEPLARQRLQRLLRTEPDLTLLPACADGRSAVAAVREHRPDLMFLDVQMPEMSGFDVLAELGAANVPAIIFVTAYDKFALRAFEAQALDYLLKPFGAERARTALERARTFLAGGTRRGFERQLAGLLRVTAKERAAPSVLVKKRGRVLVLRPDEIDHVEAYGDYVRLHVGKDVHLLRAHARGDGAAARCRRASCASIVRGS